MIQPDQRIDVTHEPLQVVRRDVAHAFQAAQDEVLGVHGAGVFRRLGEGLSELLLGAELGPLVAEVGDGLEFRAWWTVAGRGIF